MSRHNCENCTHKVVCALWEMQNELCDSECTYYQPTLTPPNEWVSVEERLPNDKQIVLFRQKNGFIYCAEYFAGNSLCSPSWFIDCDCWEAKEVTHWMPLPTPPYRRPPEGEEDT